MDLSLAANYFDTTVIDGWDGTVWDSQIQEVNLVVYDRFVSDRSFGQVKRLITCGVEIPSKYLCYRIGSRVYMLEGSNVDTREGAEYSWIYSLREARTTGDVIRMVDGPPRASGVVEKVSTTVHAGIYLDIDRFNSLGSDDVESLRYGMYYIWMPSNVDLLTTDDILIDGELYVVRERSKDMNLEIAKLVKRGDE